MNHTKKLLVLAATVVGAIGVATAGWAYWSVSGSGVASGTVGTLTAPVIGTTTQPAQGVGTLRVNWTASTGTLTPTGYYVQRFIGSTVDGPACSSSPANLISAPSCDDQGLNAAGPYNYKVTAVFRSWTAQSAASNAVTVVLDATPPTVSSIRRVGNSPTNASSLQWSVTFSENVTGVDTTDFGLARTGTVSGGSVTSVTGNGTTYTVTAGAGSGDGSLGLNLVDDDTILDQAGNKLGGPGVGNGNFTGEVYTIDRTAPVVTLTKVNGFTRPFPYWTNANVTSLGGACTTGDPAVTVTINNLPTVPASAPCTAGAWSLTLTSPLSAEAAYAVGATQTDAAGNTANTPNQTVSIDVTLPSIGAPTVTAGYYTTLSVPVSLATASDAGSGVNSGSIVVQRDQVALSGGVCGTFPASWATSVTLVGGADTTVTSGNCYRYRELVSDNAGNQAASGASGTAKVDATAPTVSSVSSTLADGSYKAGQLVPVTVTFSEPVTVTGTPQLTLNTGISATAVDYASGSGTNTLTFNYTVAAGNTSADLDYASAGALALNGGTIQDAATNNATLTLPAPGAANSLGANKNLVIDTTAAAVTINSVATPSNVNKPTFGGGYGSAAGDNATVTVTVYSGTGTAGTLVATPTVTLNSSAHTWSTAALSSALGDGTYTVAATQTDTAGNTGTASSTFVVDATAPTGSTIQSAPSPQDGTANSSDQIIYTYSELMKASSIKSAWDGTSTPVTVNFTDPPGNGNDQITIVSSNLGTIDLGSDSYVSSNNTTLPVSGTMVMTTSSGKSVVTVTLTGTNSNIQRITASTTWKWTPDNGATDLAGNATNTAQVTQSAAKENF